MGENGLNAVLRSVGFERFAEISRPTKPILYQNSFPGQNGVRSCAPASGPGLTAPRAGSGRRTFSMAVVRPPSIRLISI